MCFYEKVIFKGVSNALFSWQGMILPMLISEIGEIHKWGSSTWWSDKGYANAKQIDVIKFMQVFSMPRKKVLILKQSWNKFCKRTGSLISSLRSNKAQNKKGTFQKWNKSWGIQVCHLIKLMNSHLQDCLSPAAPCCPWRSFSSTLHFCLATFTHAAEKCACTKAWLPCLTQHCSIRHSRVYYQQSAVFWK